MEYRKFGKTGWQVSSVSFGAWAIGGSWGTVKDKESLQALHTALDAGVNLIDTADVYGDGRSERLIAKVKKERKGGFHVITKAGRRLEPHAKDGYTDRKKMRSFIERSLKNLETEQLDLVQLHCPPTEVYYLPEVFNSMDSMIKEGKIAHYGVSVEKVEEAIKVLEYPNVTSVQIIFNIFRQRPSDLFFELAKNKDVAILARVPLASGLLTGKMKKDTKFEKDDHRAFNRHGEAFDRGETFAGVNYEAGLAAVEQLKPLVPEGYSLPQFALKWILMFDAVSCVIPGAKNERQAMENAAAAEMPDLSPETMQKVKAIYDKEIKELVHHYW